LATRPRPTASPASFGPLTTAVDPCSSVARSTTRYVIADDERPMKSVTTTTIATAAKANRTRSRLVGRTMLSLQILSPDEELKSLHGNGTRRRATRVVGR
jgi:hypothetical protein